jgi:hypothetical protein
MDTERLDHLIQQGYCLIPGILPNDLRERLRATSERLLARQTEEQAARFRAQGSMLPTTSDPIFADLIALPQALMCLHELGFEHPAFSDGYVISKPGHSPRLFWHYDWFAWEDDRSFSSPPPQIFLMYYLSDTTPHTGCLRGIPGSHLRHNALHELLRAPHSGELGQARDAAVAPEFSTRPDEVDIPVKAGELVIGDARLLHATHSNETDERRTVITLWYQPDLRSLPERMQAQIAAKVQLIPETWPATAKALVAPLLARYEGNASPYERTLYRRDVPPLQERHRVTEPAAGPMVAG